MSNSVQVASHPQLKKSLQGRLFLFAALFGFLFCAALTLAPMARNHGWSGEVNWEPWIGFTIWVVCYGVVQKFSSSWLHNADPYILPIVYLLIGWGSLTIWRLSPAFGLRQSMWIVIGSLALLAVLRIPRLMELLSKYRYIWLGLCFLLVGFTLLPGFLSASSQPSLWITVGSINIQPSEPLKLFLMVYLAAYYSDRLSISPRSWALILPSLVIILISTLLLILQKDLGTATLILMLYTFVLYTISRKRRVLLIAVIILILASVAGFFTIDVIRLRFEAWLNPWLDPTARSYQIVQSIIALAAGGFFGTGPGMGAPSLVPVAISDFIFPSIVEETGLLGGAGLLVLVFILFSRSIQAARKADSPFTSLLAGGLGMLLAFQSLLIIGGNIRLIPLTGVTLPFVSYGGSSLLICMIAAGLILRISDQTPKSLLSVPLADALRLNVMPLVIIVFSTALILLPVWTVITRTNLLERGDNLRRALTDSYVMRGTIYDREDKPINSTIGTTGSYQRVYHYPALANTIGYDQPLYGLAGVEASLDPTLRGSVGYPAYQLWWTGLLTSQTPPGLDIRTSIDLDLQQKLDYSLQAKQGAGVILNAQSGEILVISSQPGFNPSTLEQDWDNLVKDAGKPLLNRAVNGQYPVGTTTALFLYAQSIENNLDLTGFNPGKVPFQGKSVNCSLDVPDNTTDIKQMLKASCPQISLITARNLGKTGLLQAFSRYGFYTIPNLPLVANKLTPPTEIINLKTAAVGQENLAVTPLQMALAAAAFSSGGSIPSPKLVLSTKNAAGQWKLQIPTDANAQVFSPSTTQDIQNLTRMDDLPVWGVVGKSLNGANKTVTWFVGGTTHEWSGSPMVVVYALEEDNPSLALDMGRTTLALLVTR
jgi:cell division protein FtsW (lipid II flippase)